MFEKIKKAIKKAINFICHEFDGIVTGLECAGAAVIAAAATAVVGGVVTGFFVGLGAFAIASTTFGLIALALTGHWGWVAGLVIVRLTGYGLGRVLGPIINKWWAKMDGVSNAATTA